MAKDKQQKWLTGLMAINTLLVLILVFQVSSIGSKLGGTVGTVADNAPVAAPSPSPSPSAPTLDMSALLDDDAMKGDKDAKVTIVEWSDFECPFCGRFFSDAYKQIDAQYIKTGKVKLVYRDFPLSFHKNAQKAAEAAECAHKQGKFWEMHDKLFGSGVAGGVETFKKYAADLGLDTNDFDTCLDSGAMASEIKNDLTAGVNAGIKGTPGFVINGQLVSGAQPFSVFKQVIDAELAK